jgi:DNA-binding transcriptional ArsR family regulator
MQLAFDVVADPTRRAILSILIADESSVGDLERRLRLPQPTVSKHLRVLRDAGFVEATIDAQRRIYRIKAEPLQELDAWLEPFRRLWNRHIDALEQHLARRATAQTTATRRRKPTTKSPYRKPRQ